MSLRLPASSPTPCSADGLTYEAAKELRDRAFAVGYSGLKAHRPGVRRSGRRDGDPGRSRVRKEFRQQASEGRWFTIEYAPGLRYAEVAPGCRGVP